MSAWSEDSGSSIGQSLRTKFNWMQR